uniref:MFS transporter n=1 Tax=Prevotella heparinolytica TaxID=28113 RepID=UPI00359FD028
MDRTTEQPRLWTGSFIRICLVNFFIFVNFHALLPTFPFFISYLGGDAVTIGLATALFSIASIVSRPFVGWLVDTRGRFTILVLGLVGMALIPMGYFVSAGIALAVLLRTAHGIFHAASSNASSTWVTDIIPHSRMGEGLGMYGLSMAISTAVAPALGLAVMGEWGFCPLFAIAALVALVALLTGAGIRSRTYTMSVAPLRIGALFEPMSLPAAVTQFFFMMAYGVVEVYVAIYAASCHLPGGGIYFIFIALATVGTRILLGRAIDKYGEARLVYSGNAAIMADNPSVFVFSMHGEKNYPYHKPKSDLDIALVDGTGDEEYLALLNYHLPKVLDEFCPDFVFYQAGVDVLADDRLGRINLSMDGLIQREQFVIETLHNNKLPTV